ncbi:uncharacterized protein At2g39795, mitochondrial-like [Mangifera indica]|uniref:uncharacterized protein At2g39795, mitochondrial-like n=1 Tax=Mangifera indica TaxID=29780 RepID=UPI001CFB7718|nr:uncharacterized protein At2g39795, mitochondrial-like [Mangifera indica]
MGCLMKSLKRTCVLFIISKQNKSLFTSNLNPISQTTRRNYVSEMRKSAFEGNVLRLLRNEIQYELEHSPPKQPITKFNSFTVDERSGEQWIRLNRKFGEKEDIKLEVTMFDGSIPVSKGGVVTGEEVQLPITLIVNITKGDGEVLEIMCSAWPDTIEITKLFVREKNKTSGQPYAGPGFKELDDELQNSLYEFLEERGIDDQLAIFLHEYMRNKEKSEFIRWMQTVKSYIEK